MTTFCEVQAMGEIRKATDKKSKVKLALTIFAIREVEKIDGDSPYPLGVKEIKDIGFRAMFKAKLPDLEAIIKEAEQKNLT